MLGGRAIFEGPEVRRATLEGLTGEGSGAVSTRNRFAISDGTKCSVGPRDTVAEGVYHLSRPQYLRMSGLTEDSAIRRRLGAMRRGSGLGKWGAAVLGLWWGLLTAFASAIPDDLATQVQVIGLAGAIIGGSLLARSLSVVLVWARSAIGLLIALHVSIAVISGVVNSATTASTLRYFALLPAISFVLFVVRTGDRAVRGFQLGLTGAGLIFVACHFAYLDLSGLLDPAYRITVFINTNSVGFISAMTAISFATMHWADRRGTSALRFAAVAACAILCAATKSRTALLSIAAGFLTWVALSATRLKRVFVAGMIVLVLLVVSGKSDALLQRLDDVLMLHESSRSIESGSFRYETWSYVISVWLQNPLLGVGPGGHEAYVQRALGVSSAHNGILASLADVGLLGTLPLIMMLLWCLSKGRRHLKSNIALPLVIAGIVESGAESMLFSMGNPGSVLFLLGLCILGERSREETVRNERGYADRPVRSIVNPIDGMPTTRWRS